VRNKPEIAGSIPASVISSTTTCSLSSVQEVGCVAKWMNALVSDYSIYSFFYCFVVCCCVYFWGKQRGNFHTILKE